MKKLTFPGRRGVEAKDCCVKLLLKHEGKPGAEGGRLS